MRMLAALAAVTFLSLAGDALAQSASAPAAATPSADDYANALMDLDCQTCEGKVDNLRGFSLATPGAARPAAPQAARPAPAAALAPKPAARIAHASPSAPRRASTAAVSAADLRLTFGRGSAELTADGEANARNFAKALNDPRLASQAFLIVGHTDATGSRELNLKLSQARAAAVKAFLVSQGVTPERLEAKGVGSQELAVPADPGAAANRRVEVRRAG